MLINFLQLSRLPSRLDIPEFGCDVSSLECLSQSEAEKSGFIMSGLRRPQAIAMLAAPPGQLDPELALSVTEQSDWSREMQMCS